MAAPKKPGGNAGKGRKAGVPNKLTKDLKAMILGALSDAGGQSYLAEQAQKNRAAFLTLLGKVLPMALEHSGDLTITRINYRDVSYDELAAETGAPALTVDAVNDWKTRH